MLDFGCKKLNIEDIIRCSFALSKSDYKILLFFLKNKDFVSTTEVKEKLKMDLSTV